MKRLLSLVLCFCLVFCLAGCKDDKKTSDPDGVDVEYYANLGKMPESDYALGDDVEEARTELEAKSEDPESGIFLNTAEYDDYSVFMIGGLHLYYDPENIEEGFTRIVSFDEAYGFSVGSVSIEIKESLEEFGFEAAERDLEEDEAFFIPGGADGCTCLEYEFKNNTVMFVFQENLLFATALYPKD